MKPHDTAKLALGQGGRLQAAFLSTHLGARPAANLRRQHEQARQSKVIPWVKLLRVFVRLLRGQLLESQAEVQWK